MYSEYIVSNKWCIYFENYLLIKRSGVAQWIDARFISELSQMKVKFLMEALLITSKQAPINGNCLH